MCSTGLKETHSHLIHFPCPFVFQIFQSFQNSMHIFPGLPGVSSVTMPCGSGSRCAVMDPWGCRTGLGPKRMPCVLRHFFKGVFQARSERAGLLDPRWNWLAFMPGIAYFAFLQVKRLCGATCLKCWGLFMVLSLPLAGLRILTVGGGGGCSCGATDAQTTSR